MSFPYIVLRSAAYLAPKRLRDPIVTCRDTKYGAGAGVLSYQIDYIDAPVGLLHACSCNSNYIPMIYISRSNESDINAAISKNIISVGWVAPLHEYHSSLIKRRPSEPGTMIMTSVTQFSG